MYKWDGHKSHILSHQKPACPNWQSFFCSPVLGLCTSLPDLVSSPADVRWEPERSVSSCGSSLVRKWTVLGSSFFLLDPWKLTGDFGSALQLFVFPQGWATWGQTLLEEPPSQKEAFQEFHGIYKQMEWKGKKVFLSAWYPASFSWEILLYWPLYWACLTLISTSPLWGLGLPGGHGSALWGLYVLMTRVHCEGPIRSSLCWVHVRNERPWCTAF